VRVPVTRRAFLKTAASAMIGATTGVAGYGYAYERRAVQVIHADVPVSGLAPQHQGLRIGLITDVHHSAYTSQADIAHAVHLLMARRPDLVVLGGDYVSFGEHRYMEPCAEALAPLAAPEGVFAILGNHDDDREMPAALERRRISVLRDRRTTLTVNGAPLDLAGIRYWTRSPAEVARVVGVSSHTTLLLAHDPRRFLEAIELAVPAILSGHTHGGQVVLPIIGAPAGRKFPVLAGGASRGGTSLFVSRGVGTVYVPIRINCPPEVAVLTLRQAAAPADRNNRHGE
jgi:predicted MPP superfamily phosphohydrolase